MAVVLFRVDDRLIHGQVVIGWGLPLGVDRIVLVDDGVSTTPWEQDLYRMAVSPEIDVRFVTLAEAAARIPEWQADGGRVLVLTGDLDTMAALYAAAPEAVRHINLGGVHHRAGRRERLPYLYLSDEELANLIALEEAGADISAQDLPTTSPVALRGLR
ncbi:MAG: PTS sugar transporter subunit IIB [Gemmatimonadales bacterium]|nr:PTS sugar transporter subunit IIB [Gemmatimonadales bacterium]MBA3556816.1 PTS sugar transporter subunit IIB [Gemmatimonadales bacterium]